MNTKFISKLSASLVLLSWAVGGHAATSSCAVSTASLKGSYGLLISGQTTASTPKTEYYAGAVTFDGVKSISGANIYGSAGAHNSLTGSYSVNSDCTVAISINIGGTSYAYTVALKATGEAAGIEVDKSAVSTITLKPQMTSAFTNASLNGQYTASCGGFLGAYSDLNLVTFNNGTLSGTDPFNNAGNFAVANIPYTGSYTVNSDGTFSGSVLVEGTVFDYFGVISNSNSQVQYFYTNDSNGSPTNAFSSCTGRTAPQQ
jgi:hypothetical protein